MRIFTTCFLLALMFAAGTASAQNGDPVSSTGPGAFTEIGYNARAVGLGSAMVAVTQGDYQYAAYNPAIIAFQDGYHVALSYVKLPFDRTSNFISLGGTIQTARNHRQDTTMQADSITDRRNIRVQIGWLRGGFDNIDARDYEGDKLGTFTSSENEFLGAAAARLNPKLALGFSARFYYASLPTANPSVPTMTSGGFGLDLGAVYTPADNLNVAATIQHIASKYHWDSGKLYGDTGSSTTDYFPIVFKVGASYAGVKDLLVAVELARMSRLYDEQDDISTTATTTELSVGAEYQLAKGFFLRTGLKGIDLSNQLKGEQSFSAGLSYTFNIDGFEPTVGYAYLSESQASSSSQMLSLGVKF